MFDRIQVLVLRYLSFDAAQSHVLLDLLADYARTRG